MTAARSKSPRIWSTNSIRMASSFASCATPTMRPRRCARSVRPRRSSQDGGPIPQQRAEIIAGACRSAASASTNWPNSCQAARRRSFRPPLPSCLQCAAPHAPRAGAAAQGREAQGFLRALLARGARRCSTSCLKNTRSTATRNSCCPTCCTCRRSRITGRSSEIIQSVRRPGTARGPP